MVQSQVRGDGQSVTYATVTMLPSTEKNNKKVRVIFIHYNISKSGLKYKPKFRPLTSYIDLPIPSSAHVNHTLKVPNVKRQIKTPTAITNVSTSLKSVVASTQQGGRRNYRPIHRFFSPGLRFARDISILVAPLVQHYAVKNKSHINASLAPTRCLTSSSRVVLTQLFH